MRLAENLRLQRLDWLAVRPVKPCCVDEKDFLKANVMRMCNAPAVGANSQPVGFKSSNALHRRNARHMSVMKRDHC